MHWLTNNLSSSCTLAYTLSLSVSISALSGGHVMSNGTQKYQNDEETLGMLEGISWWTWRT